MRLTEAALAEHCGASVNDDPFDVIFSLTSIDCSGLEIEELGGLELAGSVKTADFSRNAISCLDGLTGMIELEELYLSHNKLDAGVNLSLFRRLRKVDLSHNNIRELEASAFPAGLTHLKLGHNRLGDVTALEAALRERCRHLQLLELGGQRSESSEASPTPSTAGTQAPTASGFLDAVQEFIDTEISGSSSRAARITQRSIARRQALAEEQRQRTLKRREETLRRGEQLNAM